MPWQDKVPASEASITLTNRTSLDEETNANSQPQKSISIIS
jgi:hypothetical protein